MEWAEGDSQRQGVNMANPARLIVAVLVGMAAMLVDTAPAQAEGMTAPSLIAEIPFQDVGDSYLWIQAFARSGSGVFAFAGCMGPLQERQPAVWLCRHPSDLVSATPNVSPHSGSEWTSIHSDGDSFILGRAGRTGGIASFKLDRETLDWSEVYSRFNVARFATMAASGSSAYTYEILPREEGANFVTPELKLVRGEGVYSVNRYSPTGEIVWTKRCTGPRGTNPVDIAADQNVVVLGISEVDGGYRKGSIQILNPADGEVISQRFLSDEPELARRVNVAMAGLLLYVAWNEEETIHVGVFDNRGNRLWEKSLENAGEVLALEPDKSGVVLVSRPLGASSKVSIRSIEATGMILDQALIDAEQGKVIRAIVFCDESDRLVLLHMSKLSESDRPIAGYRLYSLKEWRHK